MRPSLLAVTFSLVLAPCLGSVPSFGQVSSDDQKVTAIPTLSTASVAAVGWSAGGEASQEGGASPKVNIPLKRNTKTEIQRIAFYNTRTCAEIPGKWVVPTPPIYGHVDYGSTPCNAGGFCPSTTLTCKQIFYTWDIRNNGAVHEAMQAHYKADIKYYFENYFTVKVKFPKGETTEAVGFEPVTKLGMFRQVLLPLTFDFSYDSVTETDPGGGGPDTCWDSTSAFLPTIHVSGGTWFVNKNNVWKFDYVGWNQDAVLYYRTKRKTPCQTTIPQQMQMLPGAEGTWTNFGPVNILVDSMTDTTRSGSRNGVSTTLDQ